MVGPFIEKFDNPITLLVVNFVKCDHYVGLLSTSHKYKFISVHEEGMSFSFSLGSYILQKTGWTWKGFVLTKWGLVVKSLNAKQKYGQILHPLKLSYWYKIAFNRRPEKAFQWSRGGEVA